MKTTIGRETVVRDSIVSAGAATHLLDQERRFIRAETERIRAAGGVVLRQEDLRVDYAISVGQAIGLGFPPETLTSLLVAEGHAATSEQAAAVIADLVAAGPDALPRVTGTETVDSIGSRISRLHTVTVARALGGKREPAELDRQRRANDATAFRALHELGILPKDGLTRLVRRYVTGPAADSPAS